MNSHFKNFEKGNTGKTGVWDIKNKKMEEKSGRKTKLGMQLTDVKNL